MSFPANTLVWALFDTTWYPAIVGVTSESQFPDADETTSCVVYFVPGGEQAVVPYTSLTPFNLDDDEKVNNPAVAAEVEAARALLEGAELTNDVAGGSIDEGTVEESEKERKKREKKERKVARKEQKRAEKAERRALRDAEVSDSGSSSESDEEAARKKKEKKAKKHAKRDREESEKVEQLATTRKSKKASVNADDDNISLEGSESDEKDEDNTLNQYIRETEGVSSGTRLHDRRVPTHTSTRREHVSASDNVLQASSEYSRQLFEARAIYQTLKERARSENCLLDMQEVDLLKEVERALRTNEMYVLTLNTAAEKLDKSSEAYKAAKQKAKELKALDLAAFCERAVRLVQIPPEKPEKRKGGKHFACETSFVEAIRESAPIPLKEHVDPLLMEQLKNEERRLASTNFSKVGLRSVKHSIMKRWLEGRELPVVHSNFDLQPVATHGAVARRFSEFVSAAEDRALNKASRSNNLSRYLSAHKPIRREDNPSYFNFHEFRAHRSNVTDSVLHGDAMFLVSETHRDSVEPQTSLRDLKLSFDPFATFLGHASGEGSLAQSADHRSIGLLSDQSMWAPDSSAAHEFADEATEAAPAGGEGGRKSGSSAVPPSTRDSSWRSAARDVIMKRVSLYVHGAHGKPSCVPQKLFSDIVHELLSRSLTRKSENDRISITLRSRENMELTEKEATGISESVDHYIRRKYLNRDRESTVDSHSVRSHSVRSGASTAHSALSRRTGASIREKPVYDDE